MTLRNLDDLVRDGQLKREPPAQSELDGLIRSGLARLNDTANETLSLESRFDLAYNAAHALSLAALRWHGYRSENVDDQLVGALIRVAREVAARVQKLGPAKERP